MDSIIASALEEVCVRGSTGIPLKDLWPALQTSISSAGLSLCDAVKTALWSRLLFHPALRFEVPDGSSLVPSDDSLISFDEGERLGLKIVAEEHLRDNFLGLYDLKAADGEISAEKKRVLERLAIARTSGITQSDLAKEFGMKGNNIFYLVRGLECHKLITRQSTIVKMKELGIDGESSSKCTQIVHTNLIHLYRYAKNSSLGSQQRFEITRPDMLANPCNSDVISLSENNASGEYLEEDVRINDFIPAMKLICDKLEEADGKVLVVSDIKQALGYRMSQGHRAWRITLNKLKNAGVVEEFLAKINGKVGSLNCLRLLGKFCPENFRQKSVMCGYDASESEVSLKHGKRGQITDLLVELPLENRIYDMIDAEGPKGITITEISKRVGLSGKFVHSRIVDMCSRYRMNILAEMNKRTRQYRVWTSKNHQSSSEVFLNKCVETAHVSEFLNHPEELSSHGQLSQITKAPDSCDNNDFSATDNGQMISEVPILYSADTDDNQQTVSDTDHQSLDHEILGVSDFVDNHRMESVPNSSVVLHEKPLSSSAVPAKLQASQRYSCIASTVNHNDGHKTLTRALNKLQEKGLCKCVQVIIPGVTNCSQSRKTEVILHPSIDNFSKELLDQIHKKQRTFDIMVRSRASVRSSQNEPATMLMSVERLSSNSDAQLAKSGDMRANGFVSAKMIRTKLLHYFLWGYLRSSFAMQNNFDSTKYEYDLNGSSDTCRLFAFDAAVKAMPLELFLQVVGSARMFDNLVKNCKLGMRLSDLPSQEYKQLMDTHATGRLSCVIDILLRLKLLRLVPEQMEEDVQRLPCAVLTHALELKPNIEEPLPKSFCSSNSCASNLHPKLRHEFLLPHKDTVDAYWETLEYCYAAADPESAKHAFPGSTVPEVFSSRSWASVRVMTVEQRAELLKRIAHDDPERKISFNECVKIARELNLTLEQVLRFSYDKRQSRINKYQSRSKAKLQEHSFEPKNRKRKQNSVDGLLGHTCTDDEAKESSLLTLPSLSVDSTQIITDSVPYGSIENGDYHSGRCKGDSLVAAAKESEQHKEDTANCSFIRECAFSRFKPMRRKKFTWTDITDRQLVMQYARHRAIVGARFHRVDWTSISDLPAPPDTCRRRMAMLRTDANIRKAVMRVCNILGERYAGYLNEIHNKHEKDFSCDINTERHIEDGNLGANLCQNVPSTTETCHWDDFEDPDIKTAIEEVFQYKKMIKIEYLKRPGPRLDKEWANINSTISSCPGEATQNLVEEWGKSMTAASSSGRNKSISHRSHGRFVKLFGSRDINIKNQVCKSLSVANAVELLKLVFLNTSAAPQVQASLSATLHLYSENDIFAAFNYLKMKEYMVIGHGNQPFVLSQKFWHSASSSPFPVDSGKRAAKFSRWLDEQERDLLGDGVYLTPHIQCGECLLLFALVSSGKLCVSPCLPDEGIGEADETNNTKSVPIEPIDKRVKRKNLKRKSENGKLEIDGIVKKHKPLFTKDKDFCSRREKGFPGIKIALNHGISFSIGPVQSLTYNETLNSFLPCHAKGQIYPSSREGTVSSPSPCCNSYPSHKIDSSIQLLKDDFLATMTSYAMQLSSKLSSKNEAPNISPEVFRCVLSALSQGGEQGLSMEEVSKAMRLDGLLLAEIVVGTLEVYQVAFKVNAYDSIRVVDSSYRSKYYINALSDHSQESYLSTKSLVTSYEASQHQSQGNCSMIKTIQNDRSLNLCDGHNITIVDLSKKADQLGPVYESSEVSHATDDVHVQVEIDFVKENVVENNESIAPGDSCLSQPILPWINGDGSVNTIVYKALSRRVLGHIMQNPGITEDDIISRMDVLNPQTCRLLLELMILDNHIIPRMMLQTRNTSPPPILQSLLGSNFRATESVFRKHLFANPLSATLL
ncbi:hypothetical protein J5N97_016301 [Dioscorea zingiberensis]|uniref:B-block binding subunit of TFIIIC domain-containing protein n=1 Tax=Dioscorea zingiberensis TaxID=325984 RepID=A0A9D5CJC6_9LILI|nr:hypothetical protein J5N97_016301 [Dioscorea zingiberensis]